MRRAERLFRLVQELRSRDGVCTSNMLANCLEVSVSTIYRDIAHLQASGLPIDGEAGVGYILRPGFDLPSTTFTHDQIDALAVGLSYVEGLNDPVLSLAAREVRAKLQASLPDQTDRTLSDAPFYAVTGQGAAVTDLGVIRAAIRDRRILSMGYCNGHGIRSQRTIRPILIWHMPGSWMVSAWCDLRGDFRTFRLDRIQNLSATDAFFTPDADTSATAFFGSKP